MLRTLKTDLHFLFLTTFSFNQGSWSSSLTVKWHLNRAFRVSSYRLISSIWTGLWGRCSSHISNFISRGSHRCSRHQQLNNCIGLGCLGLKCLKQSRLAGSQKKASGESSTRRHNTRSCVQHSVELTRLQKAAPPLHRGVLGMGTHSSCLSLLPCTVGMRAHTPGGGCQ